jgi:hypothetical protein
MIPVGALQLGLLVAIAICCVALWNQIFLFRSAGQQIVNYEPRRAVPWGPLDVVALAVGTVLIVNLCTFPLHHLEKQSAETQKSEEGTADDQPSESPDLSEKAASDNAATEELTLSLPTLSLRKPQPQQVRRNRRRPTHLACSCRHRSVPCCRSRPAWPG